MELDVEPVVHWLNDTARSYGVVVVDDGSWNVDLVTQHGGEVEELWDIRNSGLVTEHEMMKS